MVIESRPALNLHSRDLTGQRMFRVGPFGISLMYVEVKEGRNTIWRRCRTQEEWNWCYQFESKSGD